MKRLIPMLAFAAMLPVAVLQAQLVAPNDAGVTMGHLHLVVRDIDANVKFWTMLGATTVKFGTADAMKLPGVLILFRKDEPTGGSAGTIVNHVGLKVPNQQTAIAAWKAAGIKTEPGRTGKDSYVVSPDGLRVEIVEDATMTIPIANHHIHFLVPEATIPEIKAWYAKTFGAKPGKRGDNEADDLPGVNLTFSKSDQSNAPTKGSALDHIGFEIKNLEAFCKKLEAAGQKFDRPLGKTATGLSIAFITDPWGTYIELTEGLDKL